MTNDEKLKEFLDIMIINRKNTTQLVREFLIQYNPPLELVLELKCTLENQNIILENDLFDFLDKWSEYKKCLKTSIEIQQKESMRANFDSLMAKNFGVK